MVARENDCYAVACSNLRVGVPRYSYRPRTIARATSRHYENLTLTPLTTGPAPWARRDQPVARYQKWNIAARPNPPSLRSLMSLSSPNS